MVSVGFAALYPDGPPLGQTGGFGEPTCARCHFGAPMNAEGGLLGVEVRVAPKSATTNSVVVRLVRPGTRRCGFQLSARFASGEHAGKQAGRFVAELEEDARVTVRDSSRVQYVSHSLAGSRPVAADSCEWIVGWLPDWQSGAVVFHAAANAANDDNSEFGDFIYSTETRVSPAHN